MIKYAIRFYKDTSHAQFIFHATPNQTAYIWRWCITSDIQEEGRPLTKQTYQSFGITTDLIQKKGLEGLYLYCEYIDRQTKQEFQTEYIRLHSNIDKMIAEGVVFDEISNYNENGMIV